MSRYLDLSPEIFLVNLTLSFGERYLINKLKSRTTLRSRFAERWDASNAFAKVRLHDEPPIRPEKGLKKVFKNVINTFKKSAFVGSEKPPIC